MSVLSVKEEDLQKSEGDSSKESVFVEFSQSGNELEQSLKELDRLLEIAEEKIPANPRSLKNQRHRVAFQKVIAKYFRDLETGFPYKKLEMIYKRYVVED